MPRGPVHYRRQAHSYETDHFGRRADSPARAAAASPTAQTIAPRARPKNVP